MKALPFKIPKTGYPAILVQVDEDGHFYDTLHKHPEHQITLVTHGEGTLICGEFLGRFVPGDVLFFGSNQPHVFKCDEEYYQYNGGKVVRSVSLFFQTDFLGSKFLELGESSELKKFLNQAGRGIKFSKAIGEEARSLIEGCVYKKGLPLIVNFLNLMLVLMQEDAPQLMSHDFGPSMSDNEGQRMNAIMQFTLQHFREQIGIDDIASVANMSPNAFCRYFKLRTRKTYLNYLNEIRVAYACQQLQKRKLSVSQVAHLSGFNNLAHFNRSFKKVMNVTPGKYGRTVR